MDRSHADQQLWQHKPVQVFVEADAFHSVTPYQPHDIRITRPDRGPMRAGFEIVGQYGMDTFREHRFVLLVDGQLLTFHRWEDIPDQIDNVIEFTPDPNHDMTFSYTFEKDGVPFTHTHWVHHDMTPWQSRLRELLARENNGGWNARSYTHRRRGHSSLLGHGSAGRITQRLLQRNPDLPSE